MSDLGIGIVGMGWMGFIHADNSRKLRGARLVAVTDLNEERLAQAREQYKVTTYTDYRAMLEDRGVDLVIVVTPPHLHRYMVRDSLAAGKHVLCEKPLGESLASMDEIVAMTRQSDTKTMIGFLARFAISNQEARLMIDEGELGEIEYVRANFRFTSSEHGTLHGAWVFDKSLGGGILLESSPHLWDLIRYFTGADYQEVFAYSRPYTDPARSGVEHTFAAVARLSTGAIACIDMTSALPPDSSTDKRIEILGTKGTVYIDEYRNYLTVNTLRGGAISPGLLGRGLVYPDQLWHSRVESAVKREQQYFVDCILDNRTPSPSFEDGLKASEAAWAAEISVRTGRPATVADVRQSLASLDELTWAKD